MIIPKHIIFFSVVVLSIVGIQPTRVHAIVETQIAGNLVTDISPENPGSHTQVSVKLMSYEEDLNKGIIVWSLNGKPTAQGVGRTNFTFETETPGTISTVTVRVFAASGRQMEKRIVVNPADTNLLWQAQSYTPPGYKGKALITSDAPVVFLAEPRLITAAGVKIAASELYYEWWQNDERASEASGYGKDHATFGGFNIYKDDTVRVIVRDVSGSLMAEKEVSLRAHDPELIFYEESPLQGTLYARALPVNYALGQSEFTLRAEPYYLGMQTGAKFRYDWRLNDKPATPDPDFHGLITLRQDNPGEGKAVLHGRISSEDDSVSAEINLSFGGGIIRF